MKRRNGKRWFAVLLSMAMVTQTFQGVSNEAYAMEGTVKEADTIQNVEEEQTGEGSSEKAGKESVESKEQSGEESSTETEGSLESSEQSGEESPKETERESVENEEHSDKEMPAESDDMSGDEEAGTDKIGEESVSSESSSEEAIHESTDKAAQESQTKSAQQENEEMASFVGGYIPLPEEENIPSIHDADEYEDGEIMALTNNIPSSYDSRTVLAGKLPDLKNQNPYGTCWAFSSIALAEFSMAAQGYDVKPDYSELALAYFTYNTETDPLGLTNGDVNACIGDTFLERGGNLIFSQNILAEWVGAAKDADAAAYGNAESVLKSGLDSTYAYSKDVAQLVNYYNVNIKTDPDQVKELIMKNGAVGISYCSNSTYYDSDTNSYYNYVDTSTNHAVTIVGWNDSYQTKATKPGAWLVRNSWIGYEDSFYEDYYESYRGYFWLSYEDTSLSEAAYSFQFAKAGQYDHNYQYDGGMYHVGWGASWVSELSGANIFTAKACEDGEYLEAVSFETPEVNEEYTIKIYKNPTDNSNPESGTLLAGATTTGKTSYAGHYSVQLTEPVELAKGDTFSVVVTLKKDSGYPQINFEKKSESAWYKCEVSASKGQSFYKWGDGSWNDVSTNKSGLGNICIKAFTTDIQGDQKTVCFYDSDKTTKLSTKYVSSGGTVTEPNVYKPGYTVTWYTEAGIKVENFSDITITEDTNFYAKYTLIDYEIEYVLNGGTLETEAITSYTVEQNVTLPKAVKEGYAFIGWCQKEDLTDIPITEIAKGETRNKKLYALYMRLTIQPYNADGSIYQIDEGKSVTITSEPVAAKIYYTTDGSNPDITDDNLYSGEISIEADTVIKAKVVYSEGEIFCESEIVTQEYRCCFSSIAIDQSAISLEKGKTATLKVTKLPTLDESTAVVSWTSDNPSVATVDENGQVTAVGAGITTVKASTKNRHGDVVVAECTVTVPEKMYKVQFLEPNGDLISEQTVAEGKSPKDVVPAVQKDGYTVTWKKVDGTEVEDFSGIVITEDTIFYAKYTLIVYQIEYVLNGGTQDKEAATSYTVEQAVTLPNPVKVGYEFVGWCQNENLTDTPITVVEKGNTGNKKLYAKWKEMLGFFVKGNTDQVYTGKEIKLPNLAVYYNGLLLMEGTDYTASYSANKKVGEAKVKITGKGKYMASKYVYFQIKPADISEAVVANTTVKYTDRSETPKVTVVYNGITLTKNRDYTISGMASDGEVILTGKGNFEGSEKTVPIKVLAQNQKPISLSGAKVTLYRDGAKITSQNKYTYSGSANEPEVQVTLKGKELTEGTDYLLTYVNNINAGTAKVIVLGIGEYAGTKSASFAIQKMNLSQVSDLFHMEQTTVEYAKGGAKPGVIAGGNLQQNKDFKVTYSGYDQIKKAATATIQGIGNYTGKVKLNYQISAKTLNEDNIEVYVPDIVKKGRNYKTTPILIDRASGNLLTNNTDYTFRCYNDYSIVIKGKGKYTGEIRKTYQAVEGKDISKTSVSLTKTFAYDGTQLTAEEIKDALVIKSGKTQLTEGIDFTIEAAENNPVYGKCTYFLYGKGEYVGMKKFNITIQQKGIGN